MLRDEPIDYGLEYEEEVPVDSRPKGLVRGLEITRVTEPIGNKIGGDLSLVDRRLEVAHFGRPA